MRGSSSVGVAPIAIVGAGELAVAVAAVAETLEVSAAVRGELLAAAAATEDAGGGGCGAVFDV